MDISYLTTSLFVYLAIFIIQLVTIKQELFSRYFFCSRDFGDWNLHYDEKITLTDARYLYLKYFLKQTDIDKYDFLPPPVSASFGIMPTVVVYLGFRLFGYNNLGLRILYLLISGVFNVFVILTIMNILPDILGLLICLLYLFNWNLFVLTRHAIIEHILTLSLVIIYHLFVAHTDFFISNICIISFLSAGIILFKINFPLYLLILFVSINLYLGDIYLFLKTITAFAVGLIFFESLQAIILHKFGVLKWRYITLFEAFRIHGGKKHYVGMVFRPLGSRTIFVLINLIAQWFGIKRELIKIKPDMTKECLLFFIALAMIIFYVYKICINTAVLLTFVALCIVSFIPIFFYLKRMIFLIPIFYVLLAYLISIIHHEITFATYFLVPFLALILTISIYKHIRLAITGFKRKTDNLKTFAKIIDDQLPNRENIHCHGIAYRNLWQIKKHRLISCDEDLMRNTHVLDWAIKDKAKYVIITSGGNYDDISFETKKMCTIICSITSDSSDTEVPEEFILCELNI